MTMTKTFRSVFTWHGSIISCFYYTVKVPCTLDHNPLEWSVKLGQAVYHVGAKWVQLGHMVTRDPRLYCKCNFQNDILCMVPIDLLESKVKAQFFYGFWLQWPPAFKIPFVPQRCPKKLSKFKRSALLSYRSRELGIFTAVYWYNSLSLTVMDLFSFTNSQSHITYHLSTSKHSLICNMIKLKPLSQEKSLFSASICSAYIFFGYYTNLRGRTLIKNIFWQTKVVPILMKLIQIITCQAGFNSWKFFFLSNRLEIFAPTVWYLHVLVPVF